MGISCKPMGTLKKMMKKLENEEMKAKIALNRAKGSSKGHTK